ncbi:CPBP family intramembrane glutamic endopeptidase [Fimbriiglobus ruber]|uniref:CAAX prenyl protease 2/Lysostaphin resistance protein A-like domain-containing protein n=1 Tax=Fimbriiglobus ruber TaxID=1908690 RepID=A0A225DVI8_9BACT|nr:CPBP family intramembrane glutamic endopeptidase [Fimbriiglobus ruber]OWK45023.1 hypothetical protein FRUB_01354 [Fimbriiglobus ruber]
MDDLSPEQSASTSSPYPTPGALARAKPVAPSFVSVPADASICEVAPVPPRRVVRPTVVAPPPLPRASRVDTDSSRTADRPERRPKSRPKIVPVTRLLLVLGCFAGMMAVSFGQLVQALVTDATEVSELPEAILREQIIRHTVLFEGLDTLIVVAGLVIAGRPPARSAVLHRGLTWASAGPALLLLLGVNIGYHLFLRNLFKPYSDGDGDVQVVDLGLAHQWWWAILLVCVQPAVVEELMFRHLLLGHLRPHLGLHGAVWISGVVFGMAHLGNIVGWPVLMLLGAAFGYARACSGSLALPIALHFLHNFAVLGIEAYTSK